MGVGQMVLAADHVGDPHLDVVQHHREVVERVAVGAEQDQVLGVGAVALHQSEDRILEPGLPYPRHLEPDREGLARLRAPGRLRRRQVAVGIGGRGGPARGLRAEAVGDCRLHVPVRARLFGGEVAVRSPPPPAAGGRRRGASPHCPTGRRSSRRGRAPATSSPSRIERREASVERWRSVSSIRSRKAPPCWRAYSQLNSAVRADPMCRYPVGEGAKRTRVLMPLMVPHLYPIRQAGGVLSPAGPRRPRSHRQGPIRATTSR